MAPAPEPGTNPPHQSIADTLRALAERLDHAPVSSDTPAAVAQRTVEAFLDAYRTGDLHTAAALATPDISYRVPGRSTISGTFEGAAGLHALAAITPRAGARDLAETTDLVLPGPDGTAVATYHTLTATLDGQPITIELNLRFDLTNGRIAQITEYSHQQDLTDDLFSRGPTLDSTPQPAAAVPPQRAARVRRRMTRRAATAPQ